MTEEELDAAVDVISAVDAGVLQSLNQRVKAAARHKNSFLDYMGTTSARGVIYHLRSPCVRSNSNAAIKHFLSNGLTENLNLGLVLTRFRFQADDQ